MPIDTYDYGLDSCHIVSTYAPTANNAWVPSFRIDAFCSSPMQVKTCIRFLLPMNTNAEYPPIPAIHVPKHRGNAGAIALWESYIGSVSGSCCLNYFKGTGTRLGYQYNQASHLSLSSHTCHACQSSPSHAFLLNLPRSSPPSMYTTSQSSLKLNRIWCCDRCASQTRRIPRTQ